MRYVATLSGLLVLASACTSDTRALPTAPSPPPAVSSPEPPPPVDPRPAAPISVGQEVTGTLTANGAQNLFELTAPSSGTLVVRLSWDVTDGRLELQLGSTQFGAENGNPIIGRLTVVADQKYRVTVADGAPWDYGGLSLRYSLKAAIE
jgi:hypothetical protein